MMTPAMLTGLILAGGQASRMQGLAAEAVVDKGLLDFCGVPLVEHARRFLAPQVQSVLVSANRRELDYARYGQVIADDPALGSSLGPLAGVERALLAARTPWLLVLPVDVVNLPPDLMPRLAEAVHAHDALIAYARTADHAHPLCMLLHVSLADSLRHYLLDGDRKVQLWQQQHRAAPVSFQGNELFYNINTPEDLRYASQCWKS